MSTSPRRLAQRKAIRKGIKDGTIAPTKRSLTPSEVLELQEIHRLANARVFEANQVKLNTSLIPPFRFLFWSIPRGKQLAAELEAMAKILRSVETQWIQSRLAACGYPPASRLDVNMSTGEITPSAPIDGPFNSSQTA